MAIKSLFLFTLLVVVLATTQAQAQPLVPPIVIPSLALPPPSVNISGIVSCSLNASVTPSPPFPNAAVNLSCDGIVISSATTNQTGGFTITLNQTQIFSGLFSSNCNLVVTTPLSTCNTTLPSTGSLQASVQFLRLILGGVFSFRGISLGPFGFVQAS